jgi:DNA-binding response OmpR family regulator
LVPEDLFSKSLVAVHNSGRYYFGGESLRILVVEDEAKVARALQEGLERDGYQVVIASTGEEGFYLVSAEAFDLVILDLMLPGRDGLEILSTIRKRGLVTPVLILTARDAVENRVQGLDQGADDYLVKPFAFPELLARTRALLRRGRTQLVPQLQLADLEMDVLARRVRRGGKDLEFTTREFELLEYLLRHKEQVVSREMLARDVWRETSRATPLDSVIDVHMSRLRHKIDERFDRKLIHTIRGVGYVLREEL